ncbi:phosphocholine-specific phospholipase C [Streptoalloteichus hindustanus]|uniref:phospholipase C n=1 Tax=Streptoalloteichus hindustanus TaxID=2017 RepID=A0A1M5DMJ1_STRHI|nr:phospholipase C, phosphocholine-specific [Streptoalloteichus hindustanus]SHF68193.1 phospholipase C [Streptoalloteichus hindustanus]
MSQTSRRRFLGMGAGVVGAAAAGSLLPPSVHRALAMPVRPGGLRAIEHVVVLMQENRSFDHYFGTLRGVRGFGDRNALTLPNGQPVFQQPRTAGGSVLPFPVRQAARDSDRPEGAIHYIGDLDHSWAGGHRAWSKGWLDNWVNAKTAATMAYYDRRDLPFHHELADTFTLCDAYHCSVMGATNPNRMYLMTGTVGYEPAPHHRKRAVENDAYAEDRHAGYAWTTYPERLERAGVSWRVYQEWDNFQDNALEFFVRFKEIARQALVPAGGHRSLDTFYGTLRAASPAEQQRMLAALEEGVARLDPADRRLYERGLRRVPSGQLAARFRADVASGALPAVSYLVPSAADSEHPGASSPAASATITYQVLDALAAHPEVWSRTALLINYDENDGYFDHVPPPVPPDGTADEFVDGLPIGLGFRVPMIVVSPWTVGGWVCSEVFDHTSVLRFLERWLGVREDNISAWRRTVVGDLTGAFDFERHQRQPALDQPEATPPATPRWRPSPPAEQHMPVQEPGTRPARPLPYQPNAWCRLEASEHTLVVDMTNDGESSAHLAIYPYAGEFDHPRHRDVRGGHTETVPLRGDRYHLAVLGPNGFRREFAGPTSGVGADAEVRARAERHERRLVFSLTNRGTSPVTFELRAAEDTADQTLALGPRAVRVHAGQRRDVSWPTNGTRGWYDLEIHLAEDKGFRQRFAGRVENGQPG